MPHRSRDRRQARLLTVASLRWVLVHRAWTRYHLRAYLRFALMRARHPEVVTEGFVFLGRGVELTVRPGYGRLVLGAWVHLGDRTRLRANEGTLRIGERSVLGAEVTVNCHLDVEIGAACLVADGVYIGDFDHVTTDRSRRIKDQGIVKTPVRIGADVWLGTRATVLRGVMIGQGAVVGAHAVVSRDVPAYAVVVGVPARVVRWRGQPTRTPPGQATSAATGSGRSP
ncbi:MAG: acyltransferase [Actinomycetes bacterium]